MSKRGVFWGLGGLLGVAVVTLCILFVAVMGTGAQNSSQGSVEPQVTNLPTGEASDYEIAESPEVEQRAPSYQTPFQPNDRPSVALGPLPSESPPQASFAALSTTVARGETGTNDLITATITASDSDPNEGDTVAVTIELSSPLPAGLAPDAVKLVLVDRGGDMDASAADVSGLPMNIVDVLGSDRTAVVMVPLVDDMILEFDEQVQLELEVSSEQESLFVNESTNIIASGSFNITDNEEDTITIIALDEIGDTEPTSVILENADIYPVVKLAPGVIAGVTITTRHRIEFDTIDDNGNVRTALSSDEINSYDAPSGLGGRVRDLIIMAGENRSEPHIGTRIILNDDSVVEDTELFKLVPRVNPRVFGPFGLFTYPTASLYITVLDDELLEYEIEGAATVAEGETYTVRLRRVSGMATPGATISYTVSDAATGNDVDAADFGGTFPTGSFRFSGDDALSNEISIATGDDQTLENDETFQISAGGATKDVTINANDVPQLRWRFSAGEIYREGQYIPVSVDLTDAPVGGVLEPFVLGLAARPTRSNDGGTAADVTLVDVNAFKETTTVTIPVTIVGGRRHGSFWVRAVPDDVVEFDETVNVYITTVNGIPITDNGVDFTIRSNDLNADITVEDGREGDTITATIDLIGATLSSAIPPGALRLVLADGSTANAADVEIVPTDIVAALKEASTVDVPIILKDDDLVEGTETVVLELRIDSTIAPGQGDFEGTGSFTIQDNTRPAVGFRSANYEANEGDGQVAVKLGIYNNIELLPGAALTVTVEYATRDGSATVAAGDYSVATGTVTFSAGMTETTIYVDITDDSELEADETFLVTLVGEEANVNYDILRSQTTVTIIDNDIPQLELSIFARSVIDESTRGRITGLNLSVLKVDLTDAPDGVSETLVLGLGARPATIKDGGTAEDVTIRDFDRREITIFTLDAGQTIPYFEVVAFDDDLVELDETVNIYITTVNGIPITDSGVDITIRSNDLNADITVEDGREGDTITATIDLGGKTLSSAIPTGALKLVLADGSTANDADVEIGGTDIVAALKEASTVNVPIILKNDDLFEGTETVVLELRIDSTIAPGQGDFEGTGSFTIQDNTRPAVGFNSANYEVNEGDGRVAVTLGIYNNIEFPPGAALTVEYATRDGSATVAAGDYSIATGTVTFSAGMTETTIYVDITDDSELEADETFLVTLVGEEANVNYDIFRSQATVTLNANDVPQLRWGFNAGEIYPENQFVPVSVDLTDAPVGGVLEPFVLGLAARPTRSNDGGTAADVTFVDVNANEETTTVTIVEGRRRGFFWVYAVHDDVVEFNETVNVYITTVNGIPIRDSGVDITIASNDLNADITVEDGREGDTITATIDLGGKTLSSAIPTGALKLVLADGSTANDADVEIVPTDIVAGLKEDSTVNVPIRLKDDDLVEGPETGTVELRIDSTIAPDQGNFEGTGSFTIADADSEGVRIVALSKTTYNEGEDVAVTVELLPGITARADITVGYELIVTTNDEVGKASDADITGPTSGSVTINKGDRTAIITISLEDDSVVEGTELLGVRLTSASGVTADARTTQLTILDNDQPGGDQPAVGFRSANYGVDEGDGRVAVTLGIYNDNLLPGDALTVEYATRDGSATVADGDYSIATGTVTFSAGMTETTIYVDITDDDEFETDETFLVTLVRVEANVNYDILRPQTTVTIIDNDIPQLELSIDSRSVIDESTRGRITDLNLSTLKVDLTDAPDGVSETLKIGLGARPATIKDGGTAEDVTIRDFDRREITIFTLDAGQTIPYFEVVAVDDDLVELDETVNIYITTVNGIPITDSGVDITIRSNDLNADITVEDGREGDTITATIDLGGKTLSSAIPTGALKLGLADGSTTNDADVEIGGTDIVAGLREASTVNVPIILKDDDLVEGTETVVLELRIDSTIAPGQGNFEGTGSFTIQDNTPPAVGFRSANYEANEGDGRVAVTLGILNNFELSPGDALTVEYATRDGSATVAAGDYSIATGTVTFSAGMTETTIYVDITDDSEFEGDETFLVALVGVEANVNYDILRSQTTVTINANDIPQLALRFSRPRTLIEPISSSRLDTSISTVFLYVDLTDAPDGVSETLEIGLAARAHTSNPDGGTAADVAIQQIIGSVRRDVPGVTLVAGQTSERFLVAAEPDDVVEFDETVNIYITTVNGVPITHDGLDVKIQASDLNADITVEDGREGDTITATIDLGGKTLSSAIPTGALRLVLADGSTANDADVEIGATDTDIVAALKEASTVNVPIRLKDDDLVEGLETVVLGLRIDSPRVPGQGYFEGTGSFTIEDADSEGVRIAALSRTAYNEGEDVTVTVELLPGATAQNDITVGYELIVTTTDEVGKASAADITGLTSGFVTINEGDRTAIITINLADDDVFEATEQLGVRLTSASGVTADARTTQLMINANDIPQLTLRVLGSNVGENVPRTLRVELTNAPDGEPETLVLGLAARPATINDGKGDGGTAEDVTIIDVPTHRETTIVTLDAGETSRDLLVIAVDDDVVEFDETVNLYITTVNGVPITDSGVDITIRSNDSTEATLTVEDGAEGDTTMATIDLGGKTLSSAIPSDALRLVLADGSTMNADVEIGATDIVAALRETSTVNVPIRLKDDDLVEGTETVVVELRIDSTIAPGLEDLLTVGTGSFTIEDADSEGVRIAALSRTTYNEGEDVTVTVELLPGATARADITVGYELIVTTTDEVGKASAADITGLTSGSVTINEGDRTAIITINLADDSMAELTELLDVRLTSAPGITVDARTTQLTILDNDLPGGDLPAVGFRSANYEANEDDGRVAVTLGIYNNNNLLPDDTLTVEYATRDGSATLAAGDYSIATGTVTFSAGMTETTIYVDITDDSEIEDDETFLVTLVRVEANIDYDILRSQTTVTLNANDIPRLELSVALNSVIDELTSSRRADSNISFLLVKLTERAPETLVLGLAARAATIKDGGTAEDVIFVEPVRGESVEITSVTLDAGRTIEFFDVNGVADDVVEFDETVNIYITTVNGIPVADSGVDITIRSNDSSNVALTVEDGREGDTITATIDLGGKTLSSAIPTGALKLVLADGSTMNADVEIVATDIVAGLRETSTVDVPIRLKDDDLFEGTETVVLELRIDSTIAPGLEDLLTVETDSFMLADSEGVRIAALSRTTYNEGEDVTVTVELLSGLTARADITVGYELIVTTTDEVDKASAADIDESITGSVTINKGDRTAIITISLADDSMAEGTELLGVRLTSASGVTADARARQLTILDNDRPAGDRPAVGFRSANYEANEGDGRVAVTLGIYNNNSLPDDTLTVEYATRDGSATLADGDYSVATGTVTFSAGMTETTIYVDITDDSKIEGDETFLVTLVRVGANVNYDILRSQTTVTINANDIPRVELSGDIGRAIQEPSSNSSNRATRARLLSVNLTDAPDGVSETLVLGLAARPPRSRMAEPPRM